MNESQLRELIDAAVAARSQAYAPFSQFYVGAALLGQDGVHYCGVNVENSSYGLTICAERMAVGAAIAAGVRSFSAIAVASEGGVTPCGACRQFLSEFRKDLPIVMVDVNNLHATRETLLSKLLPESFRMGS